MAHLACIDHLGEASRAHFQGLCEVLDGVGLQYRINPRLVRGLDYYNLTVFEWVTERLGAQGTICGGGRYDPLIEQLGGKPAPAVGWAIGLERLLLLLDEVGAVPKAPVPDAYAVIPDARLLPAALGTIEALRARGVSVLMHPGQGSMKSQFKRADASGASHALVFGQDEVERGFVSIKPLRDPLASQHTRALSDLPAWAGELLPTA